MRKVEPLRQKLSALEAWIAAIPASKRPTAHAQKVEWDAKFGLIKINPLCDWTSDMVWEYVRANDLPYNPLHDRGYPSIGCAPCTKPVREADDPRSGRGAACQETECGLHQQPSAGRAACAPGLERN